jgi:hypothetical protein
VRQELTVDTRAAVRDDDAGAVARAFELDPDAAACRGELERITDQVIDNLLQPLLVAEHFAHLLELGQELQRLALCPRPRGVHGEADQLGQIGRPQIDLQLAGHDARQIHQVLD